MTFVVEATPEISPSLIGKLPFVLDIKAKLPVQDWYDKPLGCQCEFMYVVSEESIRAAQQELGLGIFDSNNIRYICDCLGKFIKDDGPAN